MLQILNTNEDHILLHIIIICHRSKIAQDKKTVGVCLYSTTEKTMATETAGYIDTWRDKL